MFGRYNILVEGDTDVTILSGLNQLFSKAGETGVLDLEHTCFIPCSGVSSIPHFYGMYNAFNKYASFVTLLDRDTAGTKAFADLRSRKAHVVQVPVSAYKSDAAIEDIVDKTVWDRCLKELDDKNLIELKTKQGAITGYTFLQKDRIEVKKAFSKLLLKHAGKNLSKFKEYLKLLKELRAALEIAQI